MKKSGRNIEYESLIAKIQTYTEFVSNNSVNTFSLYIYIGRLIYEAEKKDGWKNDFISKLEKDFERSFSAKHLRKMKMLFLKHKKLTLTLKQMKSQLEKQSI